MDIKHYAAFLVCGGIGIALFVYFFFVRRNRRMKLIQDAKANGWVVVGHLLKSNFILGDFDANDSYNQVSKNIAVYEFEVNGRKYKKKITFMSKNKSYVDAQPELNFYYSPQNPNKFYVAGDAKSGPGALGCLTFIIPLAIFGILAYIWSK